MVVGFIFGDENNGGSVDLWGETATFKPSYTSFK